MTVWKGTPTSVGIDFPLLYFLTRWSAMREKAHSDIRVYNGMVEEAAAPGGEAQGRNFPGI